MRAAFESHVRVGIAAVLFGLLAVALSRPALSAQPYPACHHDLDNGAFLQAPAPAPSLSLS